MSSLNAGGALLSGWPLKLVSYDLSSSHIILTFRPLSPPL